MIGLLLLLFIVVIIVRYDVTPQNQKKSNDTDSDVEEIILFDD